MNIDEMVRAARPEPPAGWAQSSDGQRVLDDVLTTRRAATVRSRPAARRLVLAALVPVAAAAVAGVLVLGQSGQPAPFPTGTNGPAPEAAPKTARELLLVAAERSATAAADGRYWLVVREHGELRQLGPAKRPYHMLLRLQDEQWQPTRAADTSLVFFQRLAATPVTAADRAAWQADGSPTRWTDGGVAVEGAAGPRTRRHIDQPNRSRTYPLGGTSLTAAQLEALPTDPAALRSWLLKLFKDVGISEPVDYALFWSGRHLVFDLPVSPGVRAAAYRMLADVKGVTLLGPATDRHGRPGLAITYTRVGDNGKTGQTSLIIDPRTGQALAEEDRTAGELTRYTILLRTGYTNEVPVR
ncbi:CU044_5270 family protein [Paractinoplanes lichenicola]|uniref:CU044_5270 family protein n=1 Tax=Paractinoplanes lichenicola TaxID=2802976 RepID=A0ABS1VGQ1_9ACTN|nr:CU044_5270 family protein [Actinoplanes lichenicola]MBL7253883.1 CU044_5270 family protein [Actinoplanes lichenicola]